MRERERVLLRRQSTPPEKNYCFLEENGSAILLCAFIKCGGFNSNGRAET
ncbi:MAG: hypothetical protein ACI4SD_02700 [Suilimivivens sp.]